MKKILKRPNINNYNNNKVSFSKDEWLSLLSDLCENEYLELTVTHPEYGISNTYRLKFEDATRVEKKQFTSRDNNESLTLLILNVSNLQRMI